MVLRDAADVPDAEDSRDTAFAALANVICDVADVVEVNDANAVRTGVTVDVAVDNSAIDSNKPKISDEPAEADDTKAEEAEVAADTTLLSASAVDVSVVTSFVNVTVAVAAAVELTAWLNVAISTDDAVARDTFVFVTSILGVAPDEAEPLEENREYESITTVGRAAAEDVSTCVYPRYSVDADEAVSVYCRVFVNTTVLAVLTLLDSRSSMLAIAVNTYECWVVRTPYCSSRHAFELLLAKTYKVGVIHQRVFA